MQKLFNERYIDTFYLFVIIKSEYSKKFSLRCKICFFLKQFFTGTDSKILFLYQNLKCLCFFYSKKH